MNLIPHEVYVRKRRRKGKTIAEMASNFLSLGPVPYITYVCCSDTIYQSFDFILRKSFRLRPFDFNDDSKISSFVENCFHGVSFNSFTYTTFSSQMEHSLR